jgi:hypothetical protein
MEDNIADFSNTYIASGYVFEIIDYGGLDTILISKSVNFNRNVDYFFDADITVICAPIGRTVSM